MAGWKLGYTSCGDVESKQVSIQHGAISGIGFCILNSVTSLIERIQGPSTFQQRQVWLPINQIKTTHRCSKKTYKNPRRPPRNQCCIRNPHDKICHNDKTNTSNSKKKNGKKKRPKETHIFFPKWPFEQKKNTSRSRQNVESSKRCSSFSNMVASPVFSKASTKEPKPWDERFRSALTVGGSP